MNRLYLKFFAAILVSLLVFAAAAAAVFWLLAETRVPRREQFATLAGELAAEVLGPMAEQPAHAQRVLERWHARAQLDLALYDVDGRAIARAGHPLPLPEAEHEIGWVGPGRGGPPRFIAVLPSGAKLVMHRPRLHDGPSPGPWRPGFGMVMLLLALAVAAGAYPVARRLTQRIERLQQAVQAMGQGDLSQRVAITGKDEVARLAASFNESAQRIEALVQAQRDLLAHTSHELRSPLARLKLALELQRLHPNTQRAGEINRNIHELDALIESLLLASRLDALGANSLQRSPQPIALDAIVNDELDAMVAAHDAVQVLERPQAQLMLDRADASLMRRLVRNLLDNAALHGRSADGVLRLKVHLAQQDALVVMRICDEGAGVDSADRERVFEPFARSASSAVPGTGLGLALVQGIAKAHGGTARYVPMPAAGSCFEVTLKA